jgi:hypothetical protein
MLLFSYATDYELGCLCCLVLLLLLLLIVHLMLVAVVVVVVHHLPLLATTRGAWRWVIATLAAWNFPSKQVDDLFVNHHHIAGALFGQLHPAVLDQFELQVIFSLAFSSLSHGILHLGDLGSTHAMVLQVDLLRVTPELVRASGVIFSFVLCHFLHHVVASKNDTVMVAGVGSFHDSLQVLLHEANLVCGALPGDGHAILLELHMAAALGEHTFDIHCHLVVHDTILVEICNNAGVLDIDVEWLCGGHLCGGD